MLISVPLLIGPVRVPSIDGCDHDSCHTLHFKEEDIGWYLHKARATQEEGHSPIIMALVFPALLSSLGSGRDDFWHASPGGPTHVLGSTHCLVRPYPLKLLQKKLLKKA